MSDGFRSSAPESTAPFKPKDVQLKLLREDSQSATLLAAGIPGRANLGWLDRQYHLSACELGRLQDSLPHRSQTTPKGSNSIVVEQTHLFLHLPKRIANPLNLIPTAAKTSSKGRRNDAVGARHTCQTMGCPQPVPREWTHPDA